MDFNMRAVSLFEKYTEFIKARYAEILTSQDKYLRNPLHYAAMSKFTACSRCLIALLNIKIDEEPEYKVFEKLYFEIAGLDSADQTPSWDPRKSSMLLQEFEHLLDKRDFAIVKRNFNQGVKMLIKEALNQQDCNNHTPLHIASYQGDFKASRLFVDMGADA